MTNGASWAERAAEQSPAVQRSRMRSMERARQIVAAARRLAETRGSDFTIQELAREAGIALQTFYKHFPSKDLAILAVIEDMITERCEQLRVAALKLDDPVDRLRFYITSILGSTLSEAATVGEPSFIATEHFRLLRLHPKELTHATDAFTRLLLPEIEAAVAAGTLAPADPTYAAWLVNQIVIAVFHHYECAGIDQPVEQIGEQLWSFLLTGLGGQPKAADDGRRRARRTVRGR
ncbi:MAG TPA: TetR/AcrR family transcriptional regulator [Mycobacteriales bacterium]|nr:TetR/AcrR family transcriptional regulator [Mycobacteriales bacterium]